MRRQRRLRRARSQRRLAAALSTSCPPSWWRLVHPAACTDAVCAGASVASDTCGENVRRHAAVLRTRARTASVPRKRGASWRTARRGLYLLRAVMARLPRAKADAYPSSWRAVGWRRAKRVNGRSFGCRVDAACCSATRLRARARAAATTTRATRERLLSISLEEREGGRRCNASQRGASRHGVPVPRWRPSRSCVVALALSKGAAVRGAAARGRCARACARAPGCAKLVPNFATSVGAAVPARLRTAARRVETHQPRRLREDGVTVPRSASGAVR